LEPFDHKLQFLLFEACNAKNNPSPFAAEIAQGDISQDEFLKKVIEKEYASAKTHHEIASVCVRDNGWHRNIDDYANYFKGKNAPWATFDKMYRDYLSDPRKQKHQELYRVTWDRIAKKNYCAKHPAADGCT